MTYRKVGLPCVMTLTDH